MSSPSISSPSISSPSLTGLHSSGPALLRWCAGCADERPFEVPPCEDGHGEDCLDLACVECGHAVVVGVLVSDGAVLLEVRAA